MIPVLVYYFFLLILGSKKEKPTDATWQGVAAFFGGREGTEKWAVLPQGQLASHWTTGRSKKTPIPEPGREKSQREDR